MNILWIISCIQPFRVLACDDVFAFVSINKCLDFVFAIYRFDKVNDITNKNENKTLQVSKNFNQWFSNGIEFCLYVLQYTEYIYLFFENLIRSIANEHFISI